MAKPRIAIVDTGSGNLRSVEKALTVAGGDAFVTADAEPGRGRPTRLWCQGRATSAPAWRAWSATGGPCARPCWRRFALASRTLASAWVASAVRRAARKSRVAPGWASCRARWSKFQVAPPLKVPAHGLERVPARARRRAGAPMREGTADGTYFYFVHSYYPVPARIHGRGPGRRARRAFLRGGGARQRFCLPVSPREEPDAPGWRCCHGLRPSGRNSG